MAIIGYASVSSVGQSLDVQLNKLYFCDKIYQEKQSRTDYKRVRLKACLNYIEEGDTLVVTRLDRLALSTVHQYQIVEDLKQKQVTLHILDQNICTRDVTGSLLSNILAAIAQLETEIRAERQINRITGDKHRGVRFRRKKKKINL